MFWSITDTPLLRLVFNIDGVEELVGIYLFWDPRLSVGEVVGFLVWSAHCCRWSEVWEGAHGAGAVPLEPY